MCVCVCACTLSHLQLFVTLWTVVCQAPLSLGFSRQDYWSQLPFPPPGDLLDLGIEPMSPVSPALAGGFFTAEPPGRPTLCNLLFIDQKLRIRGIRQMVQGYPPSRAVFRPHLPFSKPQLFPLFPATSAGGQKHVVKEMLNYFCVRHLKNRWYCVLISLFCLWAWHGKY